MIGVVTDNMQHPLPGCPVPYRLFWVIDGENYVPESNENNNVVHSDLIIIVDEWHERLGPNTSPDLVVESEDDFSFYPRIAHDQQRVTVHCKVRNRGMVGVGDYRVNIYASENNFISSMDVLVGSLPKFHSSLTFRPDIVGLQAGHRYYIGWQIEKIPDEPGDDHGWEPDAAFQWEDSDNNYGTLTQYSLVLYDRDDPGQIVDSGRQYTSGSQKMQKNEYRSFVPRVVSCLSPAPDEVSRNRLLIHNFIRNTGSTPATDIRVSAWAFSASGQHPGSYYKLNEDDKIINYLGPGETKAIIIEGVVPPDIKINPDTGWQLYHVGWLINGAATDPKYHIMQEYYDRPLTGQLPNFFECGSILHVDYSPD
jgi:hypothetical protein